MGCIKEHTQANIQIFKTQTCNNRSPTSNFPQEAAGPYVFIEEIKILVLSPNSLESVPPTIFKPNPSPRNKTFIVS